ncbi:hypothetical protein [Sphingobium sp. KCTC 72723]|uniref:hypothetical protein n=1 Tax=Sphingobium sp. KCTC 72723 TaxID=2733867 RepID=UPI00165E6D15|nr:hypothetical protein [Sphingobium sp. KCTC 72723]
MIDWQKIVKPADAKAGNKATPRERFVANLRSQLALFQKPTLAGKRHFVAEGDQTIFTARMGNMAVELLPGKRAVAIPTKDFMAVIEAIVADVEKGAFDEVLGKIAANYAGRRKKGK